MEHKAELVDSPYYKYISLLFVINGQFGVIFYHYRNKLKPELRYRIWPFLGAWYCEAGPSSRPKSQSFPSGFNSSVHPPSWSFGLEPIRAGISSSALLAHLHAFTDSPWQERDTDSVQRDRYLTSVIGKSLEGKWLVNECCSSRSCLSLCVMLHVMCGCNSVFLFVSLPLSPSICLSPSGCLRCHKRRDSKPSL